MGLLEEILTRRYGKPTVSVLKGFVALCWNPDEWNYDSVLYMGMEWDTGLGSRFASLQPIYGGAVGGYLMKNTLKVAVLPDQEIYGLYNISELRSLPRVQRALAKDPAIDYFMDSDNVWYYGIKKGDLYVFDAEFDELDSLGPIEPALHTVMDEWETARREAPGH
jgi:hypothetical protein